MATQTQTVRRQNMQPTRVHDYLYDTHFHLSSDRDHARATLQAHTSIGRVKRVPVYDTMFSELRHMPRFEMKLDVTDPVPKFISRQWRGYKEQQRHKLIQVKSFNYDCKVDIPAKSLDCASVTGANRYKYFRRPIIPFMQQVPPDVLLSNARPDQQLKSMSADTQKPSAVMSHIRSAQTQTDFRESEAQTDPYTPEYVVRPGSQPELLTLATLSYGHGLPASLAEVQMIERARAKRRWELTLPPLNDLSQLKKRQNMMEAMERSEWALREQEIEKLQEARLEVLKVLLKQREENHHELNTKRLDRLWAKKQQTQMARIKKIRHEHIRTIRRLSRERQNVEGKCKRRDWVSDYSNYASETYAPFTRIGVFLDSGADQNIVRSRYLSTYEGLLELENCLPDFVTQPRVRAPQPKVIPKHGYVKKRDRNERELDEIYALIEERKNIVAEAPKPLRFLQKIEKPVPRPPTPAIEVPNEEEETRELAVIFLQQVIRGRAIQNMMHEGKEKRIELIRELRSTHALQEAEQQMKKQEMHATAALQRQRRLHEHRENFIDSCLSQMEGSSLGDVLDLLSKELVRLQEERRVHAFAMLAERQRRAREAEESGRRLVEERRRREHDEIFKQTVKVHQQSVDSYLENIVMQSMEGTAEEQARKEIYELADKINDIAYEMEDRRTNLESEEIVSELVHSFLLPEVSKQTMREKVQRQQRKYLLAAHKRIHEDVEEVMHLCKPDTPPMPDPPVLERFPNVNAGTIGTAEEAVEVMEGVSQTTLLPSGQDSLKSGSIARKVVIGESLASGLIPPSEHTVEEEPIAEDAIEGPPVVQEDVPADDVTTTYGEGSTPQEGSIMDVDKIDDGKDMGDSSKSGKITARKSAAKMVEDSTLTSEKVREDEPVTEKVEKEKTATEQVAEEELETEKVVEEEPATEKIEEEDLATEKVTGEEPATEQIEEEEPTTEKVTEEEPATEKVTEEEPSTETVAEEEPATEKIAEEEPETEKIAEDKPATEVVAEEEPAIEKVVEEEPATEKVAEEPASEKVEEEPLSETIAEEETATATYAEDEPATKKIAVDEPAIETSAEEPVTERADESEPATEMVEDGKIASETNADGSQSKITEDDLTAEGTSAAPSVEEDVTPEDGTATPLEE